jgi:hypothetical protein
MSEQHPPGHLLPESVPTASEGEAPVDEGFVETPVAPPSNLWRLPFQGISSMQIVFGSILAISLLLAINFSGRIAAGRRIEAERGDLEREITGLQAQATARASELNYYSSDDFVFAWARGEGRMVRQNEVLVVPVPGVTTPMPPPTPFTPPAEANRPAQDNWELWWALFFDQPPPR